MEAVTLTTFLKLNFVGEKIYFENSALAFILSSCVVVNVE